MEISVTDFSAPIGASVFKFCTPSEGQSVLCKWILKMLILIFPSVFNFSFFHFFLLSLLCNTYGHFFLSKISQQLLELGFLNLV